MNSKAREIIESMFKASNAGTVHFGEVIKALMDAGVESYQVDYRALRATYYLSSDETLALNLPAPAGAIGDAFDAEGIRAAIRGAQEGKIMYPEFKKLSQQAGCVGYTVWITGRHVTYFGRRGEMHIEKFPS